MKLGNIFLAINLAWFLSEIIIGRITYQKPAQSNADKKSLRHLWLTIIFSIIAGLFMRFTNIGTLPFGRKTAMALGTLLILSGLILRWAAVFTLGRYFTSNVQILENHRFINKGVYRFVRHPAYAGSLLSFLGLGIAFNNGLSLLLIFVPIFFAFKRRITIEEQVLEEHFGQVYRQYKKQTKKIIPFLY